MGFLLVIVLLLATLALPVHADEGGVSFWIPGQYGSLAAIAPSPGWVLPTYLYYYSGNAKPGAQYTVGNSIVAELDARLSGLIVEPTYAPRTQVLGAQSAITLGWMLAHTDVDVDVHIIPEAPQTIGRTH